MFKLLKIILQRLALGALVLFAISIIIAGAVELLPGDLCQELQGQSATEETVAEEVPENVDENVDEAAVEEPKVAEESLLQIAHNISALHPIIITATQFDPIMSTQLDPVAEPQPFHAIEPQAVPIMQPPTHGPAVHARMSTLRPYVDTLFPRNARKDDVVESLYKSS